MYWIVHNWYEIKNDDCSGHGCEEVNILHSSPHGALFQIYNYSSVGHASVFLLLLNSACTMSKLLVLYSLAQQVSWGYARGRENTELGQLTQNEQRDIPNHVVCSAIKAWGKEEEKKIICGYGICLPE